jgi:hypothetical protein
VHKSDEIKHKVFSSKGEKMKVASCTIILLRRGKIHSLYNTTRSRTFSGDRVMSWGARKFENIVITNLQDFV